MKKRALHTRHLKRMKLLMIMGYGFLILFAVQWLRTQYDDQQRMLTKELSALFDSVQEGTTDSLLLLSVLDSQNRQVLSGTEKQADTKGSVLLNLTEDSMKQLSSLLFPGNDADLSLAGLKIVVRKVHRLSPAEQRFLFQIDTTYFKKEYLKRLSTLGWDFSILWAAANDAKPEGAFIFIPNRYLHDDYGILVTGYQPFLFRQLWPQAGFILILFTVIIIAFYATYRNLAGQLQLAELKNDFVSNISHELKTPIATVKVAIEAVRHFEAAGRREMTAEYMEMAELELERLQLLVNRTLHTSLLESGRLSIDPESNDLKEIIDQVLLAYQVKFAAGDARVSFVTRGSNFVAMVDKLHFQGALINLLDNSLKYGREAIVIDILLEEQDDRIVIAISDNGPGIPENYLPRVFEQFFRVPASNQHNVKGYGLGLSYVAQVMQQHKGRVSVHNNIENEGCTFVLSL